MTTTKPLPLNDNKKILRKLCIPVSSTIKEAIQNLNRSSHKIVCIIDKQKKLLGIINDGDIRRGLLKGYTLKDKVDKILQKKPLVVLPSMKYDAVLTIMQERKILQIPIVDNKNKICGIHLWSSHDKEDRSTNTVIVMAGGRGSRMGSFTEACPKPLLLIAGKPILERIIENARESGFQKFIFTVHYLAEKIKNRFGNGSNLGVKIAYLTEKTPLGTAGALSLLSPKPQSPFIVLNGDVLSDINLREILKFHESQRAEATMAVRLHEIKNPFGVVNLNGLNIQSFEEKPLYKNHVNAGIYVLNPSVLSFLRRGAYCDMPELFMRLKKQNRKIIAYPMHEPWFDIGKPEDLKLSHKKIKKLANEY